MNTGMSRNESSSILASAGPPDERSSVVIVPTLPEPYDKGRSQQGRNGNDGARQIARDILALIGFH